MHAISMRHYDIWDDDLGEPGDLEEESLAEEADFKLQNGIQEELDLEMQNQDFSDRSLNHTSTRQGKGELYADDFWLVFKYEVGYVHCTM